MKLLIATLILAGACVGTPPAVETWRPVADVATCDDLRGELCTADTAQCIAEVRPDLPRPFCVTGDATGEAQNGLGDPDGDGFRVDGFVWFELEAE